MTSALALWPALGNARFGVAIEPILGAGDFLVGGTAFVFRPAKGGFL